MSAGATSEVVSQLDALIASGRLQPNPARTARRLRDRLESPVRIALIGPPGSGKAALATVLAGAELCPDTIRLPTAEASYAAQPALRVTLADRSRQDITPPDFAAAMALAPVFVEVRAPLPMLRRFSLLTIVTNGSAAELTAAARWAARRADMAIWVTPAFDAHQHQIWQSVPDSLKDHGFLAINQADAGTLSPEWRAGFLGAYPVQPARGAQDRGCLALIDALTRQVDIGREADADSARLFLRRHGARIVQAPHRPAPPASDTPQAPSDLALDSLLSQDVPTLANSAGADALDLIRARAGMLVEEIARAPECPVEQVLDSCADTLDSLLDVTAQDDALNRQVTLASDFLVLLRLEQNAQAAQNAVIALLQLSRDVEQALAA